MTRSFAEFLNQINADATTLQSAARYVAAELSGDLSSDEMRDVLVTAASDDRAVQEAIGSLSSDSTLLLQANEAALATLWEDPETQSVVRNALLEAKSKLPVVEVTVIVLGALYALHLVLTKAKKSEVKIVEVQADGSWKESVEITFSDPSSPLSAIASVLLPPPAAPPDE